MAFDHKQWIETFKQLPGYNDAGSMGVTINLIAGAQWRVLGVHHLTGDENKGNHNVFCDVLDKAGRRLNGARLEMVQGNQPPVYAVVDKPPNEPGTNFPIWGATACNVWMSHPADDPFLSDTVEGLRINHISDGDGNSLGHHSFFICFQEVDDDAPLPPQPPHPPPTPSPQQQVGGIEVTVNVAWINTLRQDRLGNVTFFVNVNK